MKIRSGALGTLCILLSFAMQLRGADALPDPILSISPNSGSAANTVLSTWTESQYTNYFTPRYGPRNEGDGFAPAVVSGDSGWSWSQNNPTNITSTPSGTVFPNATYPIQTQAVTTFTGDTVLAPFYFKAGSTSSKSMVFNVIAYHQLGKRDGDLGNLMGAYVNTAINPSTRDTYARRIAIALLDWARWYPDYTLTGKNSPTFINTSPTYILSQDLQRASDHNGLAHEWSDTPLKAFDAIYDSAALTNLSGELNFDVREFITTNVFFFEGDFFVNHVPVSVAIGSNLSGPYDVLPEVARVLNRPDYIAWMDQYLTATVTDKIRRDGVLEEGVGYSMGYLTANANAAQNTSDYFLTRPATNDQFIAISNRAVIYNATLKYGQSQWASVALPNGVLPSFGDTGMGASFSARNAGNSALLPAYGHVSMGAGATSGTAVQENQNFPGDNNHMRSDMAAFTLWAFGNQYLDNIGYYNGAIGRNFGEQMLAHNTIEIDRVNLTPYPDADTYGNGDLTLYEPGNNGLAMTEIDGQRAYSGKASRFQRLVLLNTADLARPYLVDVFRVTGGTTHDYLLHGAINWDQSWQCSFPLTTNSNPYPMLEGSETWNPADDTPYYGFWRNVSSNAAPGNFYLTYLDANRSSGRDTRWWVTADPGTYNVYVGTTPVPDRTGNSQTNFFNYLGLKRPSAIVRHRVTSGSLQDLFVSVIEPINAGVGTIQSVDRLPVSGSSLESCAVRITFTDGRADTYLVNLRNPAVAGAGGGSAAIATADGQYALTGRVGAFMDRPGGDSRVWAMNATDFKYPGRELVTPNTYYSGWIAGSTRKDDGASNDAFTTASPLPTGTALRNEFLSLTHGALSGSGTTGISEMYRIDQVLLSNGLYNICFTNDHDLEITNGTTSVEQVAPLRTFTGSNSFEIAVGAFAGQISPLADLSLPPGGSSGPIGFNFGNLGTTAGASLQVLAASSNQTLVPNANLVIGGSGTNRTVTVTPAAGQTGTSAITVSVTDGVWTNSRTFNVIVANFAITTSPSLQSVLAGSGAVFTNVVSATNGTGTVSFGLSGLPVGASPNFNPATTAGAGTNTLTVTTSAGTPAGTYPLAITATAGSQSATNTVTLVVNVVNPTPGWSTWTGGSSSSGNWNDAANWTGSALTAGNSLAFGGITRLNNTNDTTVGTTYSNLVFNPGAGAFTLSGNPITLAVGITNNSAVPQTVALGINFGNSITFNGANSPLLILGGLTNTFGAPGSTTLTLAGTGTLTDLLKSTASSGGTNILLLNSSTANWSLADNIASTAMTAPWVFSVNNGTFSFGDSTNAPALTLTTPDNVPQDNLVGAVSGGTGVFNMNNGTLTTSSRFDTATALNSTGIVNQTGGTWNMGVQFQGANGGNAGEVSTVNLSGGTMNISSGVGPLYVASRGNGTLNVSGTGTVNCGTLDVSRNANGNSIGSVGVVNLNGGTLMVNRVSTATANSQTSTANGPAATFNFNGGTLKAKTSASNFFQGSTVAPIIPITSIVESGGAILDDGGNAITLGEPLQHDASLGANPDGGLTKLNTGTLTLTVINTYTGDTTVNAGTLALTGNGSITNSANLSVAPGATLDASGRSDGKLTVPAGQTVSGYGRLAGNLILGGAISPGADAIGAITNSGNVTFGPGGQYLFDLEDALGEEGTNWDLLASTGALDIQATTANPFVIQLRSIDGDPLDNGSGAADFGNASAQSWIIVSAAGGITHFSPDKFTVDDSAFANDLAGGYFVVQTNGSSLLLDFVPNSPPSADDLTVYLTPGGVLQLPLATLAAHWSDPDGDPVQLAGVNTNSLNGTNNVTTDGTFLYYTNTGALPDTVTYTIEDVRTNPPGVYRPGDTVWTAAGVVQILAGDYFVEATPGTQSTAAGGGVAFTVTVTPVNGFSGTVSLSVSGLPAGAGYGLSPTNLGGSGTSTLSVMTSNGIAAGDYPLIITGTSGGLVHGTNVVLSVTDFGVAATPGSQAVTAGQGTNWTVNVGASNGFSGTVALSVSGLPAGAGYSLSQTNLNAPDTATLSVTTSNGIAAGDYLLTISGTSGGLEHDATVTLSVNDFGLAVTPASQATPVTGTADFTVTVGASNGFGGTVTLSVSGVPAGAGYGLSQTNVNGSGAATLSVTTSNAAALGDYPLTITGTSGDLVHVASVTLSVVPKPNPRITAERQSGPDFILSGTNGVPGGVYYLLTGTNVGWRLTNWSVMATSMFDSDGNFSFTNSVVPGLRGQFYLLQLP